MGIFERTVTATHIYLSNKILKYLLTRFSRKIFVKKEKKIENIIQLKNENSFILLTKANIVRKI